jgi:GT2 family glycosyltransferase
MCLESIRRHTREEYELIIVDNGSTDETLEYLREQPDVILIENGMNKGFSKGCNQGVKHSSGDYIMFLNNDTVVTENWMTHLLRAMHLDERIGMVGPVTNYSSGHQRILVTYTNLDGLDEFAKQQMETYAGVYADVRRLVGFCMLTKRSILDEVGVFDEIYGLGNYEDDDLCLRYLYHGYGLRVVNDSFIHHVGHATTKDLPNESLAKLLQENARIATEKWGKNIHERIYNPEVTVGVCLILQNAESTLEQTLQSLTDDVNEIIIVDLGSTDGTRDIASRFPTQLHSLSAQSNKSQAAYYAFEHSKSDYVLLLQPGEILSPEDIRKLRAAKISVEGQPHAVPLKLVGQQVQTNESVVGTQRYLMNREYTVRNIAAALYGVSTESTELN